MTSPGTARTTERDLIEAHTRSHRAFYAALAAGSPSAELIRWTGTQATAIPVRPWFSILNSVLFEDAGDLSGNLQEIEAAYRRCDVHAWRVWVAPEQPDAHAPLLAAGYEQSDANPQRMAAALDALDIEPRVELDLHPAPTWEIVARCNDRAYGVLDEWTLAAAFESMDDPATRLYATREGEEVLSALVAREHAGDCYFWFVATVPDARGRGLASELMRHAMREAAARGCRTTSLEASAMGESAYEALGFRRLGRFAVFERQWL